MQPGIFKQFGKIARSEALMCQEPRCDRGRGISACMDADRIAAGVPVVHTVELAGLASVGRSLRRCRARKRRKLARFSVEISGFAVFSPYLGNTRDSYSFCRSKDDIVRRWVAISIMCSDVATQGLLRMRRLRQAWGTGVDAGAWGGVASGYAAARAFARGALIAPRLWLTAAHCLYDKEQQNNALTTQSSNFWQAGRNGPGGRVTGTCAGGVGFSLQL